MVCVVVSVKLVRPSRIFKVRAIRAGGKALAASSRTAPWAGEGTGPAKKDADSPKIGYKMIDLTFQKPYQNLN